jgi:hypothetical protein
LKISTNTIAQHSSEYYKIYIHRLNNNKYYKKRIEKNIIIFSHTQTVYIHTHTKNIIYIDFIYYIDREYL